MARREKKDPFAELQQLMAIYEPFSPRARLADEMTRAQIAGMTAEQGRAAQLAPIQMMLAQTQADTAKNALDFSRQSQGPQLDTMMAELERMRLANAQTAGLMPFAFQQAEQQGQQGALNTELLKRALPWRIEDAQLETLGRRNQLKMFPTQMRGMEEEILGRQQARQQGAESFPGRQAYQGAQTRNLDATTAQIQMMVQQMLQGGQGSKTQLNPAQQLAERYNAGAFRLDPQTIEQNLPQILQGMQQAPQYQWPNPFMNIQQYATDPMQWGLTEPVWTDEMVANLIRQMYQPNRIQQ